jgi:hypothetical protein
MSALGQKQTFAVQEGMSALPPKADISVRLAARPLCAKNGLMHRNNRQKNSNLVACMTGKSAAFSPLRRLYGFNDTMPLRLGGCRLCPNGKKRRRK